MGPLLAIIAGAAAATAAILVFQKTTRRDRSEFDISFHDFIDAIPDVLGIQDTERRIVGYNAAGYDYVNRRPKDVIGMKCFELIGRTTPCEQCATEGAVQTGEVNTITKHVKETDNWFTVRAYPIKDSSGKVIRVIEHLRDITEEKRLQIELKELNRDLESLVQKRTNELQNTIEELTRTRDQLIESEKLTALGRMVAGISHEVNTPLGAAYTTATFVKDMIERVDAEQEPDGDPHVDPGTFGQLKDACVLINTNLKRASDLMSSFKRIAADRESEQLRSIEPTTYLKDLVNSFSHELRRKKIATQFHEKAPCFLSTYPGALSQVFSNLIMNSVIHGYGENQSGTISFETAPIDDGKGVRITYSDDGRGMNPEEVKRIYEPFFTSRIGGPGVGLGMNIVYNLVVGRLLGTIDCRSTPGEGTCFELSIPDLGV